MNNVSLNTTQSLLKYCSSTGTSTKVTNALKKDPSTAKALVSYLVNIKNNNIKLGVICSRTSQKQVNNLSKLANNFEGVTAERFQKFARATKQELRNDYEQTLKHAHSSAGKVSPGSNYAQNIKNAFEAYRVAKAVQHNDSTALPSNLKPGISK